MATLRIRKAEEDYEKEMQKQEALLTREELKVSTDLEFLQYLGQVKSRLKKEITEDFVFATLNDRDQEGVIEMATTAYYTLRTYETIIQNATTWKYNEEEQNWTQHRLPQEEIQILRKMQEGAFDAFMTRVLMTVIMNRNKPNNPLVELLASKGQRPNQEDETKVLEMVDKIKKEVGGKKDET